MQEEIILKGITTTPSDHESTDGEIAAMQNLVNENGALVPIHQPKEIANLPANCEVYLHETQEYKHYILHYVSKYYWVDSDNLKSCWDGDAFSSDVTEITELAGIENNGMTAIANFLIVAGYTESEGEELDELIYLLWQNECYSIASQNNDFQLTFKYGDYKAIVPLEATDAFKLEKDTEYSVTEIQRIYQTLDAAINAAGDYLHKHIEIGIAALTTYDGSYTNFSDLFVLGNQRIDTKKAAVIKCGYYGSNAKQMSAGFMCGYNIKVNATVEGELTDIISGITIFLSVGDGYYDFSKSYKAEGYNFDRQTRNAYVELDRLTDTKLYDAINATPMYKTLFIPKESFGKDIELKRAVSTDSSDFSIGDLSRFLYGANFIYTYNNRLHMDVSKRYIQSSPKIKYEFPNLYELGTWKYIGTGMSGQINARVYYKKNEAKYVSMGAVLTSQSTLQDVEIEAEVITNGKAERIIYNTVLNDPLPPIIMIPLENVSEAVIKYKNGNRRKLEMSNATNGEYSLWICDKYPLRYYTEDGNGWVETQEASGMAFTNDTYTYYSCQYPNDQELKVGNPEVIYKLANIVVEEETIGDEAPSSYTQGSYPDGRIDPSAKINPELPLKDINENNGIKTMKVSEASNPFVFPSENSVTVGNGKVIGMASITQALSQGQFGSYPLYVFTTEGVWALQVNTGSDAGTYSRSTPVSRDVCINANSICQTDNAVLFATDRGIMMISGSEVTCVTEILKDSAQKIELPKLGKAMTKCGISKSTDSLQDYIYEGELHSILETCRMMYDYKCQRIIVYPEDKTYALVFSLQSSLWGMMECDFKRTLNSYPECHAIQKTQIVYPHQKSVYFYEVSYNNITNLNATDYLQKTPFTYDQSTEAVVLGNAIAGRTYKFVVYKSAPEPEYEINTSDGVLLFKNGYFKSPEGAKRIAQATNTYNGLEYNIWLIQFTQTMRNVSFTKEATKTPDDVWQICDLCDNDNEEIKPQYIITRPLKLEAPEVLKRIDSMIVRGNFRKGHVKCMLFGSRDLFTWLPVWSSTDHYLRGFTGTPYKYYRAVIMSVLQSDESISGLTMDVTTSQTNQIR